MLSKPSELLINAIAERLRHAVAAEAKPECWCQSRDGWAVAHSAHCPLHGTKPAPSDVAGRAAAMVPGLHELEREAMRGSLWIARNLVTGAAEGVTRRDPDDITVRVFLVEARKRIDEALTRLQPPV